MLLAGDDDLGLGTGTEQHLASALIRQSDYLCVSVRIITIEGVLELSLGEEDRPAQVVIEEEERIHRDLERFPRSLSRCGEVSVDP